MKEIKKKKMRNRASLVPGIKLMRPFCSHEETAALQVVVFVAKMCYCVLKSYT